MNNLTKGKEKQWYTNSGYHDWVKDLSYEGTINSQPFHKKRLENVLEQINFQNLVKDKKILEVAFNNGKTIFWALEKYGQLCEVTMFDFDPIVVEWAKKINKKWKIEILEASVENLPMADNCFDFVFCLDVVEHIKGDVYKKMISELWRVMKKGGQLIGFVGKGKKRGHINLVSPDQAIQDFEKQNFQLSKKIEIDRDVFWMVQKP